MLPYSNGFFGQPRVTLTYTSAKRTEPTETDCKLFQGLRERVNDFNLTLRVEQNQGPHSEVGLLARCMILNVSSSTRSQLLRSAQFHVDGTYLSPTCPTKSVDNAGSARTTVATVTSGARGEYLGIRLPILPLILHRTSSLMPQPPSRCHSKTRLLSLPAQHRA